MSDDSRVSAQPHESRDTTTLKGSFDNRRCGELAELAFILKATSMGFTPSRPYGERRPYDFLLECGKHLLRIQVKSSFATRGEGHSGFPLCVSHNSSAGRAAYTTEDIDFIAAYV